MTFTKTNHVMAAGKILEAVHLFHENGLLESRLKQSEKARVDLHGILQTFDTDGNNTPDVSDVDGMVSRLLDLCEGDEIADSLIADNMMTDMNHIAWVEFIRDMQSPEPAPRQKNRLSVVKNIWNSVTYPIKATWKYTSPSLQIAFSLATIAAPFAYAYAATSDKTQCVTSNIGVNIRTEASSWQGNKTVIARLPAKTIVQTSGPKVNQDWYNAITNYRGQKITGYVHGGFIGKCTP